jgi:hypothetical protein
MSLATGSCLGPYEIVSLIGAGGMGEAIGRATPSFIKVAIKVCRSCSQPTGSPSPGFEREGRSSPNHPNIAAMRVNETDGKALVLESSKG